MRRWAWLLPCWIWKYFFAQFPRERVRLDGKTRFLIRLDKEFALVYDPQGKSMLPKLDVSEPSPVTKPSRVFVLSRSLRLCPARDLGSKLLRACGSLDVPRVGPQGD